MLSDRTIQLKVEALDTVNDGSCLHDINNFDALAYARETDM